MTHLDIYINNENAEQRLNVDHVPRIGDKMWVLTNRGRATLVKVVDLTWSLPSAYSFDGKADGQWVALWCER